MFLAAVADAQPEQPPGGDGVQALLGLVQHIVGVGGGQAPHAAQTGLGVVLQIGEIIPARRNGRRNGQRQPAQTAAAADQHGAHDEADEQRGRFVRFQQQQDHDGNDRSNGPQQPVQQRPPLVIMGAGVVRYPENDGKFGDLRGLEGGETQIDPSVKALHIGGHEQHNYQQHQRDNVQCFGEIMQGAVIDVGNKQ